MKVEVIKVNRMMKHPDFKHVRDLLKKIVAKKNAQSDSALIKLSYTFEDESAWVDCRGLSWQGEQVAAVFGIEQSNDKAQAKQHYNSSGDENYYMWYYQTTRDSFTQPQLRGFFTSIEK